MSDKKQFIRWLGLMLIAAAWSFGTVGCGEDSPRTPNIDDSDSSTVDEDSDTSTPDGDTDSDTDSDSDSDPGFTGTDVEPDTAVEEIQTQLNEGAVSMGGVIVMPDPASVTAPTVEGVTDWRYGARAGYSIVQDDVCDYQMAGVEKHWKEAGDRNLPVGWGIIVSRCERLGYGDGEDPANFVTPYWNMVTDMNTGGQEIINHSITHPDINGLSKCSEVCLAGDLATCTEACPSGLKDMDGNLLSSDTAVVAAAAQDALEYELVTSGGMITSAVSLTPNFYVFPLDLADEKMFTMLQGEGYIGSRGGDRNTDGWLNSWDVDTTDPLADFKILFDAYNEDGGGSDFEGNGLDHMLDTYLNAAVAEGKWGLRELHSIRDTCADTGDGWGPVTLSLYTEHLDNVICRQDARQVWMARNEELIKYRRVRAHCGEPALAGASLSFPAPTDAALCTKYATPVTVSIQGPANTTATATGGEVINLPGGRVLVTMDPTTTATVTFGTGTTAVASKTCPTFTSGLSGEVCTSGECSPLGSCQCDAPVATMTPAAYNPSATGTGGGGTCSAFNTGGSISYCDVSSPQGYYAVTMGADGYCPFTDAVSDAKDGAQWGIQMTFADAGFIAAPKTCLDASSFQGVRVCVQGAIKNGFPKTRYVQQGLFDIADASRTPTETQNMAWVYLLTDYTTKTDAYTWGHCDNENCAHPFFAMNVSSDKENCQDIKWEDFQFPYWWGQANVGFVLPDVCTAGGAVPSDAVCSEGEDFDPSTEEPLAKWHVCPDMAKKFMSVIVAAVDDIGSDPVEVVGLKAKVSFF